MFTTSYYLFRFDFGRAQKMRGDINMLYEIGWNAHDLTSLIIVFCFMPLLFIFCLVQFKCKTNSDVNKASSLRNMSGSKSQTKFVISIVLILLMLLALSPSLPLIKKYNIIKNYKNGQYSVLNNAAIYFIGNSMTLENESEQVVIYRDQADEKLYDLLKANTYENGRYTIFLLPASPDVWYMRDTVILRIDLQQ